MSQPLKMIAHANGVYNGGVQEASNTELEYLTKLLLVKMSTESGTGDNTGDLNIDSAGSSVGTFVDNYANAEIGSHASPGYSSTTYTFKQNTATSSESGIHPLITHDGDNSNPGTIRIVNDAEVNAVMDLALAEIAKANTTFAAPGTYFISSSSPSISGTWVAQDTFYDELTDHTNDDDEKVTYKLWRKTSYDNSVTAIQLLKQINGNLKVQTEDELDNYTNRLRNRIIATGIGKYVFQTSAPGTGTWVARGSATDRKPDITSVQYTGTYSAQYEGSYSREFARQFSQQFAREFSGQYESQYTRQFQRVYEGQYAEAFTQQFSRGTVGTQYERAQYARTFSGQYDRATPGPQYSGSQYTRETPGDQYDTQYTRIATAQYTAVYGRTFSGNYSVSYTRQYEGPAYSPSYTRVYEGSYTPRFQRVYSAQYSRYYDRAQYGRTFGGYGYAVAYAVSYHRYFSTNYSDGQYERPPNVLGFQRGTTPGPWGPIPGPWYAGGFYRIAPQYTGGPGYWRGTQTFYRGWYEGMLYDNIAGPEPVPYVRGIYTSPGAYFYRGQYQREINQYYQAQYSRQFTRARPGGTFARTYYTRQPYFYRARPGPQYARQYGRAFAREVQGPSTQYMGGTSYTRQTTGPSYTRASYTRIRGGPSYIRGTFARTTTGPNYSRGSQFTRQTPGTQYTSDQFTRVATAQYTRQFARTYSAQYARSTAGPQYGRQYTRQFTGQYTGSFARGTQYTREVLGPAFDRFQYGRQFARTTGGPQYTGAFARGTSYSTGYTGQYAGSRNKQYTGDTVDTNNTSTTKTLWLRVA